MARPKMRTISQRHSENEKRRLRAPALSAAAGATLAAKVSYDGSAKHKESPRAFGLNPTRRDADDTLCDAHAGFTPADIVSVVPLLKEGIRAGLVGHVDRQGDPTILWCVSDDGWVYEARITNPGQALYHGYPLLPSDAFAKLVLERYAEWIYDGNLSKLFSLQRALGRYR